MSLNRHRSLPVAIAGAALGLTTSFASAQWASIPAGIAYNAGRVGIGTNSPSGQLHVVGSTGLGTVRAENDAAGAAVIGWSRSSNGLNYGVYGQAHGSSGYGIFGWATQPTGNTVGAFGRSDSPTGYGGIFRGGQYGVYGQALNTTGTAVAVFGIATNTQGWGAILKGGRFGVWGEALEAGGYGGYFVGNVYSSGRVGIGEANPSFPLHVVSNVSTNSVRVQNTNASTTQPTFEVQHAGTAGAAISGTSSATGASTGVAVLGTTAGQSGTGVWGVASATTGSAYGVFGQTSSDQGTGMYARNLATTGEASALVAVTNAANGNGIWGYCNTSTGNGVGVYGSTQSTAGGRGVFGAAYNATGTSYGVVGAAGASEQSWGVYSIGPMGATGTKSFQIDHPLDPANKFLTHYCSEGPEPINMYRGTVTLDASGQGEVELPGYFETLNRDFHYQLTPVGAAAVVFVSQEIKGNRFRIAGGQPNMKVCWTVTGVRNDAFVQAYPTRDEQEKPAALRGKYLHPEFFGESADKAIIRSASTSSVVTPKAPVSKPAPALRSAPASTPAPAFSDPTEQ